MSEFESNVLDAVSIDESAGLFREIMYNILLKQVNGVTLAKGVITDPDNLGTQFRPLNEKEKLFCSKKNIIIDDGSVDNNNATENAKVFSPKCGHKIHYECVFEYLQKNNELRFFFRYSSKGKLYFERLGIHKCDICKKESIIYDKEEVMSNTDMKKLPDTDTVIKIVLAKNFFQSSYDEIWIQKPSDLLRFHAGASTKFASPMEIMDEVFKEKHTKNILRFHMINGLLLHENHCKCESKEVRHTTLDEFYEMMHKSVKK